MRILRKLISIGIGSLTAILLFGMNFSDPLQIVDLKNSTYINPTLQVVAHRCSSANQLEHTFAAYQSAIDEGCRQIELDVYQSLDGTLYVSHDPSTLRLTGKDYIINNTSDEVLSSLTVHNGESLHTLQDFFNRFGDSILYLIELKEGTPALDNLQKCLEKNPKLIKNVTVQTWDVQSLNALDSRYPDMFKQLLLNENQDVASYVKCDWIDSFALRAPQAKKEDIELAHQFGKKYWVWTVNQEEDIQKFKEWGVDGVITDHPREALEIMNA